MQKPVENPPNDLFPTCSPTCSPAPVPDDLFPVPSPTGTGTGPTGSPTGSPDPGTGHHLKHPHHPSTTTTQETPMSHPPTPPASCNDCGTCEHCQESDDYGTAWRNPLFRSPGDSATSTDRGRPATETRPQPEPFHGPALTRDGFTEALLRRDGGR